MNRLFIFVFFFVFSVSSFAQITSNCITPPNLKTLYERNVQYLALNRIYEIGSPDTAFIDIPQQHLDTIWNGLAAIFNLQNQLDADSIFYVYCIHNYYARYGTTLWVYVYTDTAWTQAWQNMQTQTGYGALDSLLSQYDFQMTSFAYSNYYYNRFAVIQTNRIINYKAFIEKLMTFKGIYYAVYESQNGDGDVISYSKDTSQRFTFSMGWGDCLSGCTSRKS